MKFSIVIPLYNKAPYVAKAIKSVLSQTFTDYELIIVNDGSKDDSGKIARWAIEGHGNCRLVEQKNAGVSVARNNGVAISNGEYLCFLDADDWWEPTFLEEMARLIEEFPDAGIYGSNYTIVNETKRKTRVASVGVETGFTKGYINYCKVYAKTMYMPIWTGAVCIPRNVFEEVEGFPQGVKLGEDFLLWIRIAMKYKVVFLNKPLSFYNQDVDGANRGVGKLYKPEEHMLWNLGFLSEEGGANLDCKQLLDSLRISGLFPYFLSRNYHEVAVQELGKVDWEKQPKNIVERYRQPLALLRMNNHLLIIGAKVKQRIIGLIGLVKRFQS